MSDNYGAMVIIVFAFVLLVGGAVLINRNACIIRTEKMGIAHSWGPLQGCMVEIRPGKWMLFEQIRAVDMLTK